ncbi:protein-disulfide reductase DsbD domain-containing protein [Thalassorhabdomicrobium marinisediminis]|uniref:protein-disulfide reductase DsbD domain-containing protein n=1 Tax=Thalassorhabdomicrobium marinisediminis TaxID=2170577 RepID=UPI00248F8FE5|nr:protein-disulfide reductase DsbD domain-containing protein [Thalassorhabdomicrobium marinisediminis]
MFKHVFPLLLALVCAAPLAAGPADGVVSLEVLPGWRTDQGTHMAGLQIRLAPGWKTYWRAPGDGGIPPRFGWQGSQNMDGVAFHWPVPEVFDQNGMRSYGYAESVVIPVEVSVPDAARSARMKGTVQLGVCEDICVPVVLEFDAVLPASGARTPAIVAALVDQPTPAARAGVTGATCALRPTDRGLEVTARIEMPRHAPDEVVVIEAGDQQVWVSQPETWRDGDLFARAEMIHVEQGAFALNRSGMRITVLTGGQAVDIQGCAAD